MANNKSALKRWRQSLKRRDHNRARRSVTRTAVRRVREAVAAGDQAAITATLAEAYSNLDRAAKTGAIHTGKADRQKQRLAKLVNKGASAE
jgi:small subunit ribosomal protein S20